MFALALEEEGTLPHAKIFQASMHVRDKYGSRLSKKLVNVKVLGKESRINDKDGVEFRVR